MSKRWMMKYINNNFIILCTTKGIIKKTSLEAYSRPRQNGVNAITVREGDTLLEARMTNGNQYIMMAVESGRAIRFHENAVRPMGRTASGVRGITLRNNADTVVGMVVLDPDNKEQNILVVSEKGYGKRSEIEDYRLTNRGGKGVKTINITQKTGHLVALKSVTDSNDLMIITQSGTVIRTPVESIRVMGRATQGVRIINLRESDSIGSVTNVEVNEEDNDAEIQAGEEDLS